MSIILDKTTATMSAADELFEAFPTEANYIGFLTGELVGTKANDNFKSAHNLETTNLIDLDDVTGIIVSNADKGNPASHDDLPEIIMPDNVQLLNVMKDHARQAYSMAKENSSWAAVYTFKLSQEIESSASANDWFETEVKKRNDKIDDDLKKLVEGDSPDYAALGLYFGEKKMVRIRPREGANKYTQIIKFALDLVYEKQASLVSRYCLVLEWLKNNFSTKPNSKPAEMVNAINAAGGFEAVIRIQRRVKEAQKSISKPESIDAANNKLNVLLAAKALQEFDLNAKNIHKGFVVMIGRYAEGKVQVIGELKLSEAQFTKEVSKLDEMLFMPKDKHQAAA
jgi:hypothetical protein